MSYKVVIAGGGTGGHVYPALAIAEGLIEHSLLPKDILFIGSKHSIEKEVIPQAGFKLKCVPGKGLNKNEYLKNIVRGLVLLFSCGLLLINFIRNRPTVVIGVGGYASVAALVAATLLGIKRIVHEQNSYIGRTNYLAQLSGAKVLTTFANTIKARKRSIHVGLPLRSSFETAIKDRAEFCSKEHERFRVSVTGGSLGAKAINEAVIDLVKNMDGLDVDIVHICGKKHYEDVRKEYAAIGDPNNVVLHSYREDIDIIYSRSNLVISRAGAGTCVELETLDVDCVLIPLPSAPNDQQRHNARSLVEKSKATILRQQDLSGARLKEIIQEKVRNFDKTPKDFEPYRFHLDARGRIAELIVEHYLKN